LSIRHLNMRCRVVEALARGLGKGGKAASGKLWQTIGVMQDGANLLAVLWESAWTVGEGERNVTRKSALTRDEAMDIVKDDKFLPSMTIGQIGKVLRGLPERQPDQTAEPIQSPHGRRTSPPRDQRLPRVGRPGTRRGHVQRRRA
jgi:hypothetical protein